jgi:nucleotide-binding universal stress UspA family protein
MVVEDDPAIALTQIAEEEDADLVVVGNPGTQDPATAIGSVRDHLVHHLHCPLAAVPAHWLTITGGSIVVGVDGSAASRVALQWAVDLARDLHQEVVAVLVHDPLADSFPHPDTGWHYRGEEEARRHVASVGGPADRLRLLQVAGSPDRALGKVADDVDAAFIVVGTRGRGGLRGRIVGRVPMHLLHEAARPLVIVHHST